MANILDRFSSIIKANVNDLLDKAEDPQKMVDQYLRDLTENLAQVKEATAGVMAEEAHCKKKLDENRRNVEKYESLAKRALTAGNEDDARTFLAKKQELAARHDSLKSTYEAARENATKMREMHDKLVSDIEQLTQRKELIKAKAAVAKTQDTVNKMTAKGPGTENALNAFDRMEAKADAMLEKSNAMAELNATPKDPAEELEKKYASMGADSAVEDDLARLKKEMGME